MYKVQVTKYLISFIVVFVFASAARGQVFSGDLTLSTQTQVDSFNFTSVTGFLIIDDDTSGNITNLDSLSELASVGSLIIGETSALTSINLPNLTSVDEQIEISINFATTEVNLPLLTQVRNIYFHDNPALNDIKMPMVQNIPIHIRIENHPALKIFEMQSLTTIGGGIRIVKTGLESLAGLTELADIGRNFPLEFNGLHIIGNNFLKNIDGLSNLRFVTHITITDNGSLEDIDGLAGIQQAHGSYRDYSADIVIVNNCALTNIDGLSNITSKVGDITIGENAALANIDGLGNLYDMFGILNIYKNLSLANIDGLKTLRYLGLVRPVNLNATDLIIDENPKLKNLNGLSNLIGARNITITDNDSLTEFCGLYTIFTVPPGEENWGLQGLLIISGNAVNTNEQQIVDAGPCLNNSAVTAVNDLSGLPTSYSLSQNFPNPFNPATVIRYSLPEAGFVKLKIYNALGEAVRILVDEVKEAGNYEISFDASALPSGIYIYKIESGNFTSAHKMTLLK